MLCIPNIRQYLGFNGWCLWRLKMCSFVGRVCLDGIVIKSSGLGVRNLIRFNRALMGKWLWCYATQSEAIWKLVIDTKYDSLKEGLCSKEVIGTFGVGVWKYIRGWERLSKFVRFEVSYGSHISFLHDVWCREQSLEISYPNLFSITRCKDAWVDDH